MSKWEYCQITIKENPLHYLLVAPEGRIDIEWVTQKFPSKMKIDKGFGADRINGLAFDELWKAYYSVIEYMCSSGWEPFATSKDSIHLRRMGE